MPTAQSLANRIREVYLNGKWIANTNIKEQLADVTRQQALQKTGTLNSIAMLTYHLNYYLQGLIKVLQGGPLDIKDQYSFDLPAILSATEWEQLKNDLLSNAEIFASKVEALKDDLLSSAFVNENYGTYERNIEAVIEHSYYHLGQITLIRKLLPEEEL